MSPSKILFYFCLSFIGGIFLSSIFKIPLFLILAISVLGLIFISVFWSYRNFVIFSFCLLFLVLGIFRHQLTLSKIENSPIKNFLGKEVILIGIVDREPDMRGKTMKLKIENLKMKIDEGWNDISAAVLVTTNRYPEYRYGDELKIWGKLENPPEFEGFNYKNYLLKDGILAVMDFPKIELLAQNQGNFLMKNLIFFKEKLKESLNKIMARPQSAILEALFFGEEENISKKWKEKLNQTATRHLTAVSGMNITIITFLIINFLLMLGFWRQQAFYLSIILIIFYILLIGAPASAIRAGIMGLLLLTAQHFGRFSTSSRAIVLAATLMLFQNPLILRWDIGFQLSFLATMGMIHLQQILGDFFKRIPRFLQLRNNLSTTLSAQIFTLPILIYNFGQISLISPLTNIFILPLIPWITILGFIFSFIGIFWQGLAQILSWPAWLLTSYVLKIIDLSFGIPFASLTFKNVHWIFLIISYLILSALVFWLNQKRKLKFLNY